LPAEQLRAYCGHATPPLVSAKRRNEVSLEASKCIPYDVLSAEELRALLPRPYDSAERTTSPISYTVLVKINALLKEFWLTITITESTPTIASTIMSSIRE
jgi:hypothetical protein